MLSWARRGAALGFKLAARGTGHDQGTTKALRVGTRRRVVGPHPSELASSHWTQHHGE